MVEFKSNYSFAGILIAFALIVGGVTYSLTPTGNYKVCDNGVGWILNNNDGYYYCGDRYYDCLSVRNTKGGKPNYFCDDAVRVEVKEVAVESSCRASVESVSSCFFISFAVCSATF